MEDDARSVSGVAVFLGTPDFKLHNNWNAAVIFFSAREHLAIISVLEAELLAIGRAVHACIYVQNLRSEIGFPQEGASLIFTDSLIAIRFLQDSGPTPNRQTRHIRRRVEFIRQAIAHGRVRLEFVPGIYNCADVLTKPLGSAAHCRHAANLMGQP
jgi:hypothetical protein